MKRHTFAEGALSASALGLGCSRLGSMTATQTPAEAKSLIATARALGVSVFDTANIYAQGRSESLLGEALGRDPEACIITKAGQVFPLKQRLLAPLRGPVSALLKRSKSAQAGLRAVRANRLPRNYTPEHLASSLEKSLKRLRRDDVAIFLLHSPDHQDLADGAALDAIQALKRRGLARVVGVSCDDDAVLNLIAGDPRVEAIQAPFGLRRQELKDGLSRATARGALVIAREIMSPGKDDGQRPSAVEAVEYATRHPDLAIALLGTSNPAHLQEAVQAAG